MLLMLVIAKCLLRSHNNIMSLSSVADGYQWMTFEQHIVFS